MSRSVGLDLEKLTGQLIDPNANIKLTRLTSTTLVHLGALSYMFGTETCFHFQDPVKKDTFHYFCRHL